MRSDPHFSRVRRRELREDRLNGSKEVVDSVFKRNDTAATPGELAETRGIECGDVAARLSASKPAALAHLAALRRSIARETDWPSWRCTKASSPARSCSLKMRPRLPLSFATICARRRTPSDSGSRMTALPEQ